jgi:hypothetical protein
MLAVLLALSLGGCAIRPMDHSLPPGSMSPGRPSREPAPNPMTQPTAAQDPARAVLDTLADTLTNTGYDTETGRYTYTHLRTWDFATNVLAVFDDQLWLGTDGSGREQQARYPDQPPGAVPRWPTGRAVHTDVQDFAPGGYDRSLPEAASPDPTVLAAQLDTISPRANGPQSVLRAVADLYRDSAPTIRVRAALLHLLADTPGLTLLRQVTDRAGRVGIGVSIDSDTRDLLILDPHTGVLLAYEATQLIKPPGSMLAVGAVRESVLYLGAALLDQDTHLPVPPAT